MPILITATGLGCLIALGAIRVACTTRDRAERILFAVIACLVLIPTSLTAAALGFELGGARAVWQFQVDPTVHQDGTPAPAVCDTDASCQAWERAHGSLPLHVASYGCDLSLPHLPQPKE